MLMATAELMDTPADAQKSLINRHQMLVERLRSTERRFGRAENSVCLIAVSKTYPIEDIRAVANEGQRDFGENQVQEAMSKIPALEDLNCTWHFIGPIQSNKCRAIANNFDWVHSIDRLKIARRLSDLRPTEAGPLNILLQVNQQGEASKAGVPPDALSALVTSIRNLPNVRLRGLMAIPSPEANFERQRAVFANLRNLKEIINHEQAINMDSLSMGMTNDLEAAVAEGATHVRIGTAIFGVREPRQSTPLRYRSHSAHH